MRRGHRSASRRVHADTAASSDRRCRAPDALHRCGATWNGNTQFVVGSYKMRIQPYGNAPVHYRVNQLYLDKSLAAGIEIKKSILTAMVPLF